MSSTRFPSFTKTFHHTPYGAIAPGEPSLSTAGKVIFITGGGKGIGKAIASAFVEAGAKAVIITGRTESSLKDTKQSLIKAGKTAVEYFVADITDASAVEHAFSVVVEKYGKIDVLVANAGYLSEHVAIADSPLDDYWRGFEINVKGPIVTSQAFLKVMAPKATLVNIISGAAHIPYIPGYSGYSTSKLASIKFMYYLHMENPSLRVFNLQPGTVDSDMSRKAGNIVAEDDPNLPAAFSVWLASEESEFLRGRLVWANWDVNEMMAKKQTILEKDLLTLQLSGWPAEDL